MRGLIRRPRRSVGRRPAGSSVGRERRGTVYLVTLSTAMIVTVMGVSGLIAVRVQHRSVQLEADLMAARHHARSAAELAMWHVEHDTDWHELEAAERSREHGLGSFGFRYRPWSDEVALGASRCESVWIEATGRQGDARARLEVLLEPRPVTRRLHRRALAELGAIACWPLNEADGATATDYIGERDGTYHDVNHHDHDPRHCLYTAGFNGSGSVVEIEHHDAFMVDSGSIVLWFRTREIAEDQGLFSKSAVGFGSGGHLTLKLINRRLRARLSDTSETYQARSDLLLESGRWYHVAFTFGEDGMHLYIDGEHADMHNHTGGTGPTSGGEGNREPIVLGADASGSSSGSITPYTDSLNGNMFDVAFFNRALDSEEVRELYAESRLERRYHVAAMGWRDRVD